MSCFLVLQLSIAVAEVSVHKAYMLLYILLKPLRVGVLDKGNTGKGLISGRINVCRGWETSPPGSDKVLASMCETGPWDTRVALLPLIVSLWQ